MKNESSDSPSSKPNTIAGSSDRQQPPTKWYLQSIVSSFSPLTVPTDWTEEKDLTTYDEAFGLSETCRSDITASITQSLEQANRTLEHGIRYFSSRDPVGLMPVNASNLTEKIGWFTELVSRSNDIKYINRFAIGLAPLLWLESERKRLIKYHSQEKWLFPFWNLADVFEATALSIEESLSCEHDDYNSFLERVS